MSNPESAASARETEKNSPRGAADSETYSRNNNNNNSNSNSAPHPVHRQSNNSDSPQSEHPHRHHHYQQQKQKQKQQQEQQQSSKRSAATDRSSSKANTSKKHDNSNNSNNNNNNTNNDGGGGGSVPRSNSMGRVDTDGPRTAPIRNRKGIESNANTYSDRGEGTDYDFFHSAATYERDINNNNNNNMERNGGAGAALYVPNPYRAPPPQPQPTGAANDNTDENENDDNKSSEGGGYAYGCCMGCCGVSGACGGGDVYPVACCPDYSCCTPYSRHAAFRVILFLLSLGAVCVLAVGMRLRFGDVTGVYRRTRTETDVNSGLVVSVSTSVEEFEAGIGVSGRVFAQAYSRGAYHAADFVAEQALYYVAFGTACLAFLFLTALLGFRVNSERQIQSDTRYAAALGPAEVTRRARRRVSVDRALAWCANVFLLLTLGLVMATLARVANGAFADKVSVHGSYTSFNGVATLVVIERLGKHALRPRAGFYLTLAGACAVICALMILHSSTLNGAELFPTADDSSSPSVFASLPPDAWEAEAAAAAGQRWCGEREQNNHQYHRQQQQQGNASEYGSPSLAQQPASYRRNIPNAYDDVNTETDVWRTPVYNQSSNISNPISSSTEDLPPPPPYSEI